MTAHAICTAVMLGLTILMVLDGFIAMDKSLKRTHPRIAPQIERDHKDLALMALFLFTINLINLAA